MMRQLLKQIVLILEGTCHKQIEKNSVMEQIVKLIMNSFYAKLLESLDKRSEFKIVDNIDSFLAESSKDTFHSAIAINNNFILISNKNINVRANNTPHTGASVLYNSKLILLQHFYTSLID